MNVDEQLQKFLSGPQAAQVRLTTRIVFSRLELNLAQAGAIGKQGALRIPAEQLCSIDRDVDMNAHGLLK